MGTPFFIYPQPSYDKVIPVTFSELGFSELVSVYNELKELGRPPPIIDAAELQKDPEVLLYCFLNYHTFF